MSDINFGDHTGDVELLPENTYKVRLKRWEKCLAKTQTEQVRWFANVVGGEHDGAPLIDHLQLLASTHWKIANFVKAAQNWGKDELKALGSMGLGTEKFSRVMDLCKDRLMWWTVEVDTFGGKPRNKVNDYVCEPEQAKLSVDAVEDTPEWVKNKE